MRQCFLPSLALLSLAFGMMACAFPMQPVDATPAPTATPAWATYNNQTFGFSISHPPGLQTPAGNAPEPYGFIGDQVNFNIAEVSPLDCRGDCPVIETTSTVQVAGQSATRITGMIGSVGGNVPQQYESYVFTKDSRYYTFTLYAVPIGSTPGDDLSTRPLRAEDIQMFEQMLATFRFTP